MCHEITSLSERFVANPDQGGQQQGSQFRANSLQDFIRAADERLNDYLQRSDEGDVEEGGTGGGAHAKNLAEKIGAIRNKRDRYGSLLAAVEGGRREPDIADRSRQPGDGRPYERWRRHNVQVVDMSLLT
jgi:hypothetical protein